MRFLSFSQPWLWAVLDPIAQKHIENRNWQPAISCIGERFALHAAKSFDESAFGLFRELGIDHYPARYDLYPTGVICGVATLDRIVTETKTLTHSQRRWFFETRADGKQNYGWVLTDVRTLTFPIQHRGAQGFRHLDPSVAEVITRQLAP
jgi:hypothetical protein